MPFRNWAGTVGEELLTPTRLYVKPIRAAPGITTRSRSASIRGLANITGGGLPDNVPRILPPGKRVVVQPRIVGDAAGVRLAAEARQRRRGGDVPRLQHGHRLRGDLRPSFAKSIVHNSPRTGIPAWSIGEVRDGEVGVEIV